MNKDLALIYDWLCENRLSVNSGKTEFIVFRPPRHNFDMRLTLKFSNSKLFESRKIKYLGLILDNKLNWKPHITELCKKLSRAVGMLYKIRSLCPTSVLKSLYFSLFHSHLSYGMVVWGTASLVDINKIKSLQKKAINAVSISEADTHASTCRKFYTLNILNINDLIHYQMSSIMWEYDHGTLPLSLRQYFKRSNTIHSHKSRAALSGKLHHTKVNTLQHGIKAFKYQGIIVLNNLKQLNIYKNAKTKVSFLRKLKYQLISKYIS